MNAWQQAGKVTIRAFTYLLLSSPFAGGWSLLSAIALGLVPTAQAYVLRGLINALQSLFLHRGHYATSTDLLFLIYPLIPWLAIFAALLLINGIVNATTPLVNERVGLRVQEVIMQRCLSVLTRVPLVRMDDSAFHDTVRQAQQGGDSLTHYTATLLDMTKNFITAVSLLIYLGTVAWELPLFLMLILIPYARSTAKSTKQINQLLNRQTEDQRRTDYLNSLLLARDTIKEVRLFGLKDYIVDIWRTAIFQMNDKELNMERKRMTVGQLYGLLKSFCISISQVLIYWRFFVGSISIGLAVSISKAINDLDNAVNQISWRSFQLSHSYLPVSKLFDLLGEALEEETSDAKAVFPDNLSQGIVCESVSFSYPGQEKMSLNGVDLSLKPGEVVALVGENGSGKTTLAKLLLGLYEPTSGSIQYDGRHSTEYDIESLRHHMSAVFQDFGKYEVTLRENVGFGDTQLMKEDDQLKRVLQEADAADILNYLPAGLDTVLGKTFKDGHDLSGGQWQKVASARALLRNSSLLVLDEPTAALDPKAEIEVLRQFMEMSQGKSTLIISHRIGCARLADRIVVLDNGHVAEQGTHDELINSRGKYAELFQLQAQWYA